MFRYFKIFYLDDHNNSRVYDIAIFEDKRPRKGVVYTSTENDGWMIRDTISDLKGIGAQEITKFEAMVLMGRDPITFYKKVIGRGPQWLGLNARVV